MDRHGQPAGDGQRLSAKATGCCLQDSFLTRSRIRSHGPGDISVGVQVTILGRYITPAVRIDLAQPLLADHISCLLPASHLRAILNGMTGKVQEVLGGGVVLRKFVDAAHIDEQTA